MEPVQFNVGDTFDTFTAFKERLQQYEKTNFINTSIGKSRTIESKKRELKKDRYFNEILFIIPLLLTATSLAATELAVIMVKGQIHLLPKHCAHSLLN